MTEQTSNKASASLQIFSVAIIYSTSNQARAGCEAEKIADCDAVDSASAVQLALQEQGYQTEVVKFEPDPSWIDGLKKYDWVFNLTETIYGFPMTDYEVARQLERRDIHFTGAGSSALRACLDKAFTKSMLHKHGLATPLYEVYYPGDPILTHLNFPVIIKPVQEDGSIGIGDDAVANNTAQLVHRVKKIHRVYEQAALVEEFIEGKDITVSIMGNGDETVVLPLSEIIYSQPGGPNYLTFEAKWVTESVEFQHAMPKCPCDMDPAVEKRLKDAALQAYRLMGCRDYARVDFRLKGSNLYILEVNPNPSIAPFDSGYVRAGIAAGFNYNQLINRILEISIKNSYMVTSPVLVGADYESYVEGITKRRSGHPGTDAYSDRKFQPGGYCPGTGID